MITYPPLPIASYKLYFLVVLLLCLLNTSTALAQENVYNMSTQTVEDCSGTLYDSGGPDDRYADGESLTFSICPSEAPACIRLEVLSFAIENTFDILSFYDGPDTNSTLLGRYPTLLPDVIDAHSGCLTIHFSSDLGTRFDGWEMNWNCYASPGCPALPVSPQDCIGAIPICQNVYMEEEAYIDEGNIDNEINKEQSCLGDGEKNSVWYTFTVQESGDLSFLITPNNDNDDYDWAVYNLTDANCSDLFDNSLLELSCSFSQQTGATGPTGESDLVAAGADDGNKNAKIPVEQGDIYVINVSQFSTSTAGYSIDFSASTAIIFDQVAPSIKEVELVYEDCELVGVDLFFTENVLCSSVNAFGFNLRAGSNIFVFGEVISETCVQEGELAYAKDYRLLLQNPIAISDSYLLNMSGAVEDLCGNMSEAGNSLTITSSFSNLQTILESEVCETNNTLDYRLQIEGELVEELLYQWTIRLPDGTAIDSVFNGANLQAYLQTGNTIPGVLEWDIQDLEKGCLFSGQIELGLDCSACSTDNAEGGNIIVNENLVCAEETLVVENETAFIPSDYLLTYFLVDELGAIQATNNEGIFSLSQQNLQANTTYQVNSVINTDENGDGLADMEGDCTVFSNNQPTVIFLAPIDIIIVGERCVDRNYELSFTITGGLPAFDESANYSVTGDYEGIVAWGDTLTVTYQGDAAYQLTVAPDLQLCTGTTATRSFPYVCTPAPIELLDFWGETDKNGILLTWNTVSEKNNAYFAIEHKGNRQKFASIATIKGSGTSNRINNYHYLDKAPLPGRNYYRLIQVDLDGQSTIVGEIALTWGEKNYLSIQAWNWPSVHQPIIADLYIEDQPAVISLLTIEGKIITQSTIYESGQYSINTPVISSGIYLLQLSDGLRTVVSKIAVQ